MAQNTINVTCLVKHTCRCLATMAFGQTCHNINRYEKLKNWIVVLHIKNATNRTQSPVNSITVPFEVKDWGLWK